MVFREEGGLLGKLLEKQQTKRQGDSSISVFWCVLGTFLSRHFMGYSFSVDQTAPDRRQ